MAGTETKRIIELTEASTVQNGDYIAIDSNARGTKKVSTDTLATSAALTAETNARAGADEQMSERMDGIEEQTALIQNPTKTLSGALVSFTDGADMPMLACTAEITPKQSGTGTPSPSNVRPISGWESVALTDAGKNLLNVGGRVNQITAQVTYTSDDNYVILNGTKQGASYANLSTLTITLPAGTYYAKAIAIGGTTTNNISIYPFDGSADVVGNIMDSEKSFTLSEEKTFYFRLAVWSDGTVLTNYTIGIVVSMTSGIDNFYPYNGHTTTTPLGRTVYGGTLDVVTGVLTAYPFYPSYNGETLGGRWICDRAVYAEGTTPPTGSQVALISGTGTTYTLTGQEISTLLGDNNVWADSGDVEITYRRDISIVLENLENALSGSNSLNAMMMSAPTENTAEEPTEDEAEDDMR